jgi:hypothetical protein
MNMRVAKIGYIGEGMLFVTGRKITMFYILLILLLQHTTSVNTVLGNSDAGSGVALESEAHKADIAIPSSVLTHPSLNIPCLQKGRITSGPCDPGLQSKNLEDAHGIIHVASSSTLRRSKSTPNGGT